MIQSFDGLKPVKASTKTEQKIKAVQNELAFNPTHLNIYVNELQVARGKIWIEYGYQKPVSYFDVDHIRMNEINASIKQVKFIEDTITANVESLQVKERSGFVIKKLITKFRFTPKIMEFDSLLLRTNNSTIGNYYAMVYDNFGNDFQNYISKVVMKSHLVYANVATDDIAYFAPELKNINQKINLSSYYLGTVEDFKATDLSAKYNNSFVKGSFSMKGIPDMRKTQIAFNNVNALTNYNDLRKWIPSLNEVKKFPFEALGDFRFKGDFKGTLYDFVTNGAISTKLGLAETEIRLK